MSVGKLSLKRSSGSDKKKAAPRRTQFSLSTRIKPDYWLWYWPANLSKRDNDINTSTWPSYCANTNIDLTVRLGYSTPYNFGFSLMCRACMYMRQYQSHLREIDTHPEWYPIPRFIWCWCSGRASTRDYWRWGKREFVGQPLRSPWWKDSKKNNFTACKYEFMCARDAT